MQDYLGSIAEVTTSSGALDVGESFTAFGARRDASDWSGPVSASDQPKIDAAAEQGYTLHSNLRGGPFVHMNGRVLDSVTGRFLSADPYVPGAGFTQSFNRYSYVFNNPMSYTDPSGFFPDFDFIYGRDEGRLGVSITIGRSSGPKGSARRQAKGCFVPYATKCYGKGRANDPYEIVFDMPGGPMERYGIPDHLILNVQDGSWEDGGMGGITVWENVKASFWSFGEGVVVEFVVEPAKDAAEYA